jgi:CheY-like chemotaxis protein
MPGALSRQHSRSHGNTSRRRSAPFLRCAEARERLRDLDIVRLRVQCCSIERSRSIRVGAMLGDLSQAPVGGRVARIARSRRSIDLVVTDVIMHGCGGPELLKRLHVQAPALRVLYMSGYTEQGAAHDAGIDRGLPFVQKPLPRRSSFDRCAKRWIDDTYQPDYRRCGRADAPRMRS